MRLRHISSVCSVLNHVRTLCLFFPAMLLFPTPHSYHDGFALFTTEHRITKLIEIKYEIKVHKLVGSIVNVEEGHLEKHVRFCAWTLHHLF